jgi:hypothetical protein
VVLFLLLIIILIVVTGRVDRCDSESQRSEEDGEGRKNEAAFHDGFLSRRITEC